MPRAFLVKKWNRGDGGSRDRGHRKRTVYPVPREMCLWTPAEDGTDLPQTIKADSANTDLKHNHQDSPVDNETSGSPLTWVPSEDIEEATITVDDEVDDVIIDSGDVIKSPVTSPEQTSDWIEGRVSEHKTEHRENPTTTYTLDAFLMTDGRSKKRRVAIPERARNRYSCNECGKSYATSSNLSRHKQTHRSLDSSLAKKCPHCNKVYVSMPALAMHVLTHDLRHKCTVCDKAFSRPWLLQGHLRSHTGLKPYGCAHCGKAFADRSNLRAHMQTHSSFKHFSCKRCNKTFALKSYLNKHCESACLKDSDSSSGADEHYEF